MISRQRTAGSVSVPGIPGGWYPSVRGSTRSAARGQPRRQRPLPRPGGPRRRGGGAAPPRRAAHSPHPNTTGPHSSTPVHHRIHPRPSLSLSARACGPAAHAGSARAICCAGTRHHRANCSCATASSSTSALARPRSSHPIRFADRHPPVRSSAPSPYAAATRCTNDHVVSPTTGTTRRTASTQPPPPRHPTGRCPAAHGAPAARYRCTANERRGCPVPAAAVVEPPAFWMPGMRAVWPPRPLTPRRLPRPVQTQPGQAATVNTPPPFTASVRAY